MKYFQKPIHAFWTFLRGRWDILIIGCLMLGTCLYQSSILLDDYRNGINVLVVYGSERDEEKASSSSSETANKRWDDFPAVTICLPWEAAVSMDLKQELGLSTCSSPKGGGPRSHRQVAQCAHQILTGMNAKNVSFEKSTETKSESFLHVNIYTRMRYHFSAVQVSEWSGTDLMKCFTHFSRLTDDYAEKYYPVWRDALRRDQLVPAAQNRTMPVLGVHELQHIGITLNFDRLRALSGVQTIDSVKAYLHSPYEQHQGAVSEVLTTQIQVGKVTSYVFHRVKIYNQIGLKGRQAKAVEQKSGADSFRGHHRCVAHNLMKHYNVRKRCVHLSPNIATPSEVILALNHTPWPICRPIPFMSSTAGMLSDQMRRLIAAADRICPRNEWELFFDFDETGTVDHNRNTGSIDLRSSRRPHINVYYSHLLSFTQFMAALCGLWGAWFGFSLMSAYRRGRIATQAAARLAYKPTSSPIGESLHLKRTNATTFRKAEQPAHVNQLIIAPRIRPVEQQKHFHKHTIGVINHRHF